MERMRDRRSTERNNPVALSSWRECQSWLLALVCSLAMAVQPGHAADQSGQINTDVHKVEQGETLWDIAERYLGDPLEWRQLQPGSGVEEPRLLQPGTTIPIPAAREAFPATVLHLKGEGWRTVPGGGDQPLAVGMTLDKGEEVRTGAGTHLSLMFADGSRMVLPSLTAVTLTSVAGGSPRVILREGEMEAYVEQPGTQRRRLEVETSVGVLGVRGTHFRVRDGEERTLAEVLKGKVASSRPQSRGPGIEAGYGLVMQPSGPLDTVALLPAPVRAEQRHLMGADPRWQVRAEQVGGAVSYHAEVSTSPDFLQIMQAQSAVQPEFDFSGLEAAFYHVRIVAVDGEGLRGMPGTFVLAHQGIDPTVSVEEIPGGLAFRWSRPAGWRYGFQVAVDEDFRHTFADRRNLAGSGVKVGRLPPGRYYWRLFLDAEGGNSQPLDVLDSGVVMR